MSKEKFHTTIFESLGSASVAWSETPTGVFDSRTCEQLGLKIIEAAPVDYIDLVKQFHKNFDHPIMPSPIIPLENRCVLRHKLLEEEVTEFKDGFEEKDIVAVADALADIQYVLSGAILEFGLQDKFEEIFREVQRSNMSKACKDLLEAQWTIDQHRESTGIECTYVIRDGLYFVLSPTGKTIKSINYSPANIKDILFPPSVGPSHRVTSFD